MRSGIATRLILIILSILMIEIPGCEKSETSEAAIYEAQQLRREGKFAEALSLLERLLEENRGIDDGRFQARCRVEKALNLWHSGKINESREAFLGALKAIPAQEASLAAEVRHALEIVDLYLMAKANQAEKRYDLAESRLKLAVDLSKKYGLKDMELKCLFKLAFVYFYKNDMEGFVKYSYMCISLAKQCRDNYIEIQCLLNLGFDAFNRKDFLKGYEYFEEAKIIAEQENMQEEVPALFNNLGVISYYFGQFGLAEYYLEKAYNIYEKQNDLESMISLLYARALTIYKNQKINGVGADEHRVEGLLQQALALSRSQGLQNLEARILNNLGYVNLDRDITRAEEFSRQAWKLGKKLKDEEVVSSSLNNLGEIYLRKKHIQKAISCFEESQKLALGADFWTIIWNNYTGLAQCYEKSGNYYRAIDYYQKALKTIEKLRNNIGLDLYRIGFDSDKKRVYEGIIRSLVKLQQARQEPRLDEFVFSSVKKIKARVFLEEVLKLSEKTGVNGSSEELAAMDRAIGELLSKVNTVSENEKKNELLELEYRYLRLATGENQASGLNRYDWQPVTLKEVKSECLANNQVILDYYLNQEESFCFLISKNEFKPFFLPGEAEVEKAIKLYIKLISRPEVAVEELKKAGNHIREIVLPDELLDGLKEKSLVIIPDGLLNYLPFETLPLKSGDGLYLVEKYSVSYLPSMAALMRIKKNYDGRSKKEFLGIGNPYYEAAQKSYLTNYLKLTDLAGEKGKNKLKALPFTETELREIAGLFPSFKYQLLVRREASEENLKKLDLKNFRIIHFACHGLSDEKNPLRSALMLSPGIHRREDGFLTLREIYNLQLESDLVVLSTCESSRGTVVKKEGVIGFPRLFLLVGSQAVVSTLWPVDDRTAADFMKIFYRELLSGNDKDDSLRKTKVKMMASGKNHPYYWAAFILSGNKDKIY
ncbi:MAG: CHAT domain-containing protein [Candidatus Saccharicenans sp.]